MESALLAEIAGFRQSIVEIHNQTVNGETVRVEHQQNGETARNVQETARVGHQQNGETVRVENQQNGETARVENQQNGETARNVQETARNVQETVRVEHQQNAETARTQILTEAITGPANNTAAQPTTLTTTVTSGHTASGG